jgi:hypothetical protein
MYLRFARRRKDGKEHRYWSIVESRRCAGGRVVQRPLLYLGEINDGQREAWCHQMEAFDEASGRHRQLALFPAEQAVPDHARGFGVQVRLDGMKLHRPRQWGACWLACHIYEQLQLDRFFAPLLPNSREGTSWQHILQTLVCYRLIDPRRPFPDHRRPHLDPQPLHRTHRRPETSGPPTQARSSATDAATYHRARKDRSSPNQRRVVETSAMSALMLLAFFSQLGKLG